MAERPPVIVVDTNVIIDVFDRDPIWFDWSVVQLSEAAATSRGATSVIVIAELSRNFDSIEALQRTLRPFALELLPLDEPSAFLAGKRFQDYRRDRPDKGEGRVLADFFIGANALTHGASLLTRDQRLYRRFFPDLPLITPETHPHG